MNQQIKLRLKRIFTEYIGLKILALLGSVFLWLLVVNVDDPNQTKTFTVAVSVTNEDVLEEAGKYYTIVDGNNTVNFKVTAKRSVMEKISDSDFVAVADMNYMEDDSRIPVSVSYRGNSNNVTISAKKLYIYIEVGTQASKTFDIQVETTGDVAEGHVVSQVVADNEVVVVNGPSEVISTIDKVVAYIDVTDASADISRNCSLHLLDAAGNDVDYGGLMMDKSVVRCTASILACKSVPISFKTTGTLDDGLTLEGVTFNPQTIEIMGESSAVNEISSIEISGNVLNLTNITETTVQTVDITSYLPSNVKISAGRSSQVQMTIKVSGETSVVIGVPGENVKAVNVADGYTAEILDSTINLSVSGEPSILKNVAGSSVTGTVDLSGLTEGTYELSVKWNVDEGVTVDDVKVKVKVSIKS